MTDKVFVFVSIYLPVHHLAETSAFAVRVHRFPEAVSMGCARFTVVAARASAELHGEHHSRYHFDRPLAADFLDVNFFF